MDSTIIPLFEKFKAAASADSMANDSATAKKLLPQLQLKIAMQKFPAGHEADEEKKKFLLIARETMELALLLCVKELESFDIFARRYAQLKPFYSSSLDPLGLPRSEHEMLIEGLHLMFLLSQNKVSEFYTALESIPVEVRTSNRYVSYPVELEQLLTEGAYSKVLRAREAVPDPCYEPFVGMLTDAVRKDVAGCMERAYESLDIATAMRYLLFKADDKNIFEGFIASMRWSIESDGRIHFPQTSNTEMTRESSLSMSLGSSGSLSTLSFSAPGMEDGCYRLIHEMLAYSKELERIV